MVLASLMSEIEDLLRTTGTSPGHVVGISHAGERAVVCTGVANVATGLMMEPGSSFLLGSVTKLMTTSLVLRFVERGAVRLDDPVTDHLPGFRLRDPEVARGITVRMLLDHSNGIDADTLFPGRETGPGAVASYVEDLAARGNLFAPGQGVTYSNPGMTVAGRLVEILAGDHFGRVLERELFGPLGMDSSVTTADRAILRNTAVGTFPDLEGRPRTTPVFMLPPSAGPAGTTPIVTAEDLLTFAETHLRDGGSYLRTDTARLMRTPSHDFGGAGMPAFGLGWMLSDYGDTTAAWHAGGSPGGASQLVVLPEHDLAIVAFGNSRAAPIAFEAVNELVIRSLLGISSTAPTANGGPPPDLSTVAGTYQAGDIRHQFRVGADPATLVSSSEYLPFDDEHGRTLREFFGAGTPPAGHFRHVRDRVFAPAARPLADLGGLFGQMSLISFNGPEVPTHLYMATRRTNRVEARA